MTEQEENKRSALESALYAAASSEAGFALHIRPDDELRLALSGHGELTLWIAPQNSRATPLLAPKTPAPREADERGRVRITGRIASPVRYAPLKNKGLRVGFTLAEHLEDGETRYHRVYATGDYARRTQRKDPQLGVGDEVTIEGARQRRTVVQNGRERELEEIYCYGLRVSTLPRRSRAD
jgi:hypothetical protein